MAVAQDKSFEEIKRECLHFGRLFEDPDFPAIDSSLFHSREPPRPFEWKRPKEICDDPQLFIGGANRLDVNQGMLGNCWMLAAIAGLSSEESLFSRVIPSGQGFGDGYSGCFLFCFWRSGTWEEVVIDDRLPTYNDKLIFVKSDERNEFWSSLLEKAFAKLHGSYEALKGGKTSEAMEDLTGGLCEGFDLRGNLPSDLFSTLLKAKQRSTLMGCSIHAQANEIEAKLDNGLIKGHAYSITDVRKITLNTTQIAMVRVLNPWGNEREWIGAWSDNSTEWKAIAKSELAQIGLSYADDGEFWMSYEDFVKSFDSVELCHLSVEGMDKNQHGYWNSKSIQGSWRRNVTAGGCRNFSTFSANPQYRVTLTDADDEDEENMGTLIIALMQKNRRQLKKTMGNAMLTIGFVIYEVTGVDSNQLDKTFLNYHKSTARSATFINSRETCGRFRLPPGEYCIIPCTFKPNEEGDYLLRIFSEKPNAAAETDEVTTMSDGEALTEDPKEQVNTAMQQFFYKCAGENKTVDAYELKIMLESALKQGLTDQDFNVETCKSMIALVNDDKSGELEFEKFAQVFKLLTYWKGLLKKYDKDRSGALDSLELRDALRSAGFTFSNRVLEMLAQRYNDKTGQIPVDNFIMCIARLKIMFGLYKKMTEGGVKFDLNEFLLETMFC